MKKYFRVVLEKDEDGFYIATVPELPGCVSDGKTRKEALSNIKDAIAGYIQSLEKHHELVPPSIKEEIISVNVA